MRFPNPTSKIQDLKSKAGFTLIELIVYFGLFSLLLLILTNVFSTSIASQLESESLSSVEHTSRYLLLKFSKDIASASSIVIPAAAGDTSQTLRLVINGQNTDYALTNGNLTLTNNTGTYNLNNYGTSISNLQITRRGNINGKNTLTVSFTITSNVNQNNGLETKSFNATFGTR